MPEQGNALLSNLLIFAVFFGLMWFMLIRPQQQQQKRRREMLARLKAGDKVVTIGGIFGTLTRVDEDTVRLRIADKVEIRLSRDAVARVLGQDD
ncbi:MULTISPECIES: preprotein translocase subunit YajC [Thermaerobacter]|uniref:Preprotein translocase, YajC subunit n=1 Tax=Thermaerobacter subterraneus DSM 13965 TaxID=867903 RepID=K6PYY4_9FIRM|nr:MULTISPECIES: preprotein translocase subunit YajC [Thermaerobacter]EKP93958.1 preprotein translocase, YajC subunit [Thermaerobacter subterraneus DSM 13965]QIA26834.1 preprotein translocase subunit YajC [Thermaerobacter sp. PB12/4term]